MAKVMPTGQPQTPQQPGQGEPFQGTLQWPSVGPSECYPVSSSQETTPPTPVLGVSPGQAKSEQSPAISGSPPISATGRSNTKTGGKIGRMDKLGEDLDEFHPKVAISDSERFRIVQLDSAEDGLVNSMYERHLQHQEMALTQLQAGLESGKFNLVVAVLIFCNAVTIGLETDSPDLLPFSIVEKCFLGCYVLELSLRFWVYKWVSFKDTWYVFDIVVVGCAIGDLLINALNPEQGADFSHASILRIVRLVKLVRLFRLLRFFKELLLLVNSIASAMRTLLWTWVLLGLVIYVFSIMYTKLLGHSHPGNQDIQLFFGTVIRSAFTLFAIMTLDWADTTRVIWDVEPVMVIVTLVFITITAFAIMNVVIAVIVESTIQQAMSDQDDKEAQMEDELKQAAEAMIKVFSDADVNADGKMSKEEWKTIVRQPRILKIFSGMDVECDSVEALEYIFDRLDINEDGKITMHEFVQGVLQLRGQARAKRVFEMHCDVIREANINNKQINSLKRMQKVQSVALDEIFKKVSNIECKMGSTPAPHLTPQEKEHCSQEVQDEPKIQASSSLAVGCTIQLIGMKEGSPLNGRVGTIVRNLSTASCSEFLVDLGEGTPPILVQQENLRIADQDFQQVVPVPAIKQEVSKEVNKASEMQVVPTAASAQCVPCVVQPVLLTAVARQSAALRDVEAKIQMVSDAVISIAHNSAHHSPRPQAATQIIYSQPPQAPGMAESAMHALEKRMTVRSAALEQEVRALRETILQCLPVLPLGGSYAAPTQHFVRDSQVLS